MEPSATSMNKKTNKDTIPYTTVTRSEVFTLRDMIVKPKFDWNIGLDM